MKAILAFWQPALSLISKYRVLITGQIKCLLARVHSLQHSAPTEFCNLIPDSRAFKSDDLSQTVYRTLRDADWRKRNAEMTGLSEVPNTNDRAEFIKLRETYSVIKRLLYASFD